MFKRGIACVLLSFVLLSSTGVQALVTTSGQPATDQHNRRLDHHPGLKEAHDKHGRVLKSILSQEAAVSCMKSKENRKHS